MANERNPQLNDADFELLSAYVDSQLAPDERADLERRLAADAGLRAALAELRATVGLLRELEPLAPPRSFAIDPRAAAPRRGWSFPWMTLGSALVALFVLVAFGAALLRTGAATTSAPMAAMPQEQAAAASTAAPMLAAPPAAASDPLARQAGGGAPENTLSATQGNAYPAPEAPIAAAGAVTSAPAADSGAAAALPTAAPAMTSPPEPSALPAPAAALAATPAPEPSVALPAVKSAAAPTAAAPGAESEQTSSAAGAQVATSPISSPDTATLEQPLTPTAANASGTGASSFSLIVGAIVLALLLVVGVAAALRRRR